MTKKVATDIHVVGLYPSGPDALALGDKLTVRKREDGSFDMEYYLPRTALREYGPTFTVNLTKCDVDVLCNWLRRCLRDD